MEIEIKEKPGKRRVKGRSSQKMIEEVGVSRQSLVDRGKDLQTEEASELLPLRKTVLMASEMLYRLTKWRVLLAVEKTPERPPSSEAPEVMTVEELADYLRLGVNTIYSLAREGEIPAAKVKGTWRFSKAAVDKWLVDLAGDNVRK